MMFLLALLSVQGYIHVDYLTLLTNENQHYLMELML